MSSSPASSPAPIAAIDRALRVLTALAHAGPHGMSLADLSQTVDANKSTVYRVVNTMKLRGFATQDPDTGIYVLGANAISLADRFPAAAGIRRDVQPALAALSRTTHELIHLGILSGDMVQYVDKIESDQPLAVRSRIGRTAYAYTTGLGRAILAAQNVTEGEIQAYVPDTVASRDTVVEHVWSEIQRARRLGWSREREENEHDVACVGIPLVRKDGRIAAVSITGPASRMTPTHMADLADEAFTVLDTYLPAGYQRFMPA